MLLFLVIYNLSSFKKVANNSKNKRTNITDVLLRNKYP